ncbi:MAG: PAS domain S-box protein [Chloroflexi bacterium]|nr:PAS domain S-box protein [Chloroflexota bacterium]
MPGAKVLIVEDEAIEALDIQQRLTGLGYQVPEIASSGEEGVYKAGKICPDVVLMDIMLPGGIDGIEAAEQIRSRFDIPVIFLTAYGDQSTLERAKITEPYGYIIKPFQERELHIAIDIALYKHRMEKKLKKSEELFRGIFEASPVGIVICDARGKPLSVNAAALQIPGLSEIPQNVSLFDDPNMPVQLTQKLKDGETVCFQLSYDFEKAKRLKLYETGKSGATWLDVLVTRLGAGQNPGGYLVMYQDITERKKREELIRFQSLLVDSTHDAIISATLNPEGEFITRTWNKGAEILYGWEAEEVVGKPTMNVLQPEFPQSGTLEKGLNQLFELGHWHGEVITKRKDGSQLMVLTSQTVLRDDAGNITGAVGVHHDVTDLKNAEEKLKTYERLATIGQLSGSIAHELRNPLGLIDSSAFLLQRRLKNPDEGVTTYLERIREGVRRSTGVIQSLLDVSRMKPLDLKVLDLKSTTAEIIDRAGIPSTVLVTRDFPEQGVPVNADRALLRIAFGNIIANAVQAMEGKGELRVGIITNTAHTEVSFTDTGPGIAPENLRRIFEPLFSTKMFGIGLGLSIVQLIVEKHGGTIEVSSELGKGAKFAIKLPLTLAGSTEDSKD